MLPSQRGNDDDSDDDSYNPNRRRYRQQQAPGGPNNQQQQHRYNSSSNQPPPLGLTGVLCDSNSLVVPNGRGTLHYTIFRPRSLANKPPLICIAGGPGIPCTYLSPLVHLITDRSIILYDHLGSGQSQLYGKTGKKNGNNGNSSSTLATSSSQDIVNDMVQDFAFLVQNIPWNKDDNNNKVFHLYGHSFGGIIAYEYLQQLQQQPGDNVYSSFKCQSLVLSSTPVSIPQVLADTQALQAAIRQEIAQGGEVASNTTTPRQRRVSVDDTSGTGDANNATADLQENDDDARQVAATFSQRHECRVHPIPLPLEQAWQMAAYASSANRGLEKVQHYVAAASRSSTAPSSPADDSRNTTTTGKAGGGPLVHACLILRGQYDFVSMDCFTDWLPLLQAQPQPPPPQQQEEYGPTSGGKQEEEEDGKEENKDIVMDEAAGDQKAAAPPPPTVDTSFTIEMVTLEKCSHYGMFENEQLYKDTLNGFLQRHDPKNASEFITLPNGVRVRR